MAIRAAATSLALLAASVAWTGVVPPADSVAAVLEEATRTFERGRQLAPALELPLAPFASTACFVVPPERGTACIGLDLTPCLESLVVLYDALRGAPPQPSPGRVVTAELLAEDAAAAIVRVQAAVRAVGRGRCDLRDDPRESPARLLVGPTLERLVLEPLVPLHAGVRYALVVDGLSPADWAHARAHVVPRPGGARLAVPTGAFVAPAVARQAPLGVLDLARTTAFLERLERDAAELPAWPAIAGVSITLPAPLAGAALAALRVRYLPADSVPADRALVAFDVLDVRAGLLAYRRALAELPCREEPGEVVEGDPILAGPFPHVGALLRLRVESFDLGNRDGAPTTLGAAPDSGRPVARPLLAAIPRNVAAETPMVLLVGGLRQSAAVMLAGHAEGITAHDMMAVTLELPHQGARADGGDMVTLLDPAAQARDFRQAAIDALAAIQSARRCGFLLPGGRRVRPSEVRYAGYSLGAMIGTIVRSLEPDLGATVLFAPGGDHAEWSGIRVAQALGSPLLACVGGADDGRSCFERRSCAPPGVCAADPAMYALSREIRLPYTLAVAGGEPLAFAGEPLSEGRAPAPLLLLTGGTDNILPPNLAGRLADAYGLAPAGPGRRARGSTTLVEAPDLGHELSAVDSVRERAYVFLASRGAQLPEAR